MDFSNIRLIATDMDGTLLNSNHEVSTSFEPVFKKLKERGIIFVAASGRQYYNLLKTLDSVKDDVIFAAENGSYVVFRDEEIHVQSMPHHVVRELIQISRTIPDTFPIICGKKKAYVETAEPDFIDNLRLYFERFEIVDNLMNVDDDEFLKFTLCDLKGSEVHSYPHFKHLEDQLKVKVSGPIWLDISHPLANKGVAMEVLQRKFGISYDQTMIFGDYFNDLEMLQKGYFSYAMANAHEDIRKIARFTAKSNNENGVVEILNEVAAAPIVVE